MRDASTDSTNSDPADIDLSGIWGVLLARKKWVIGPVLGALVLSAIFVNVVKPRYTAEARVLLEAQESFIPRAEKGDSLNNAVPDAEAVGSQVQLVTSRDLARRAIKAIGLNGNPEFDPLADGMGVLTRLMVLTGLKRDPTAQSPEERVLESYFDKLSVFSPPKTRVLSVEFQSRDPDLSARAANTIADLYLDFQQDAKRESARAAASSLASLLVDLRQRVAEADARAEDYRQKSGLFMGANNTSLNNQQMADVNTEISKARTTQADAQSKARIIREMLKQGRVGDVAEIANNDMVRRIGEQRVSVKAQLALESRTLLPGHPRVKELSAQLADLDNELRAAADKAARGMENDAKIAGGRVDNLVAALDAQKKIVGSSSTDEIQMRELDRAVRLQKDELEATTAKYQEALAKQNSRTAPADARIISRALAPQMPTFPKKLPIIAFATIAALVASIGILISQELFAQPKRIALSGGFVMPVAVRGEQVSVYEGAQLANNADAMPVVARKAASQRVPSDDVKQRAAAIAKSIIATRGEARTLALCATGSAQDDAGFIRAVGGELATHNRTILVAMDDGVETGFGHVTGLAELIAGDVSFAEVIHRDPNSRLHILPAGKASDEESPDLGAILDALMQTYEIVIVALAATLNEDHAEALAHRSDIAIINASDTDMAATLAHAFNEAAVPHVLDAAQAGTSGARSAA